MGVTFKDTHAITALSSETETLPGTELWRQMLPSDKTGFFVFEVIWRANDAAADTTTANYYY